MSTFEVKWQSKLPVNCEICEKVELPVFIDGTHQKGNWSIFCEECYASEGVGYLGVGIGQMYDGKTGVLLAGAPKYMTEG